MLLKNAGVNGELAEFSDDSPAPSSGEDITAQEAFNVLMYPPPNRQRQVENEAALEWCQWCSNSANGAALNGMRSRAMEAKRESQSVIPSLPHEPEPPQPEPGEIVSEVMESNTGLEFPTSALDEKLFKLVRCPTIFCPLRGFLMWDAHLFSLRCYRWVTASRAMLQRRPPLRRQP